MNLVDYIKKAQDSAFKNHIKANVVVLNKHLKYCREGYSLLGERKFVGTDTATHYPPMLFGLSMYLTDELPDEIAFGLFESENQPLTKIEEIKNQARKEFIEELKRMSLEDIIKMLGDTENE